MRREERFSFFRCWWHKCCAFCPYISYIFFYSYILIILVSCQSFVSRLSVVCQLLCRRTLQSAGNPPNYR
ncbi:hypothetical protein [Porphyromonas phage phage005b_ATCC49417]|uniref:Uncharacterized protein n=1 Tax=Porphyromonas phage phage005a_ATCC49417 TaxID=3154097 RepID=A0AAT9J7Z3_9VIRU